MVVTAFDSLHRTHFIGVSVWESFYETHSMGVSAFDSLHGSQLASEGSRFAAPLLESVCEI